MRISDWSSDVCSSDLAESRKTEWVLAITGAIFGCELTIEAVRHAGKPCAAQGWHPGKAAFRIPKLRTQYPGLFSTIGADQRRGLDGHRSEEHTSELQSLMRISYAVFCLNKKKH